MHRPTERVTHQPTDRPTDWPTNQPIHQPTEGVSHMQHMTQFSGQSIHNEKYYLKQQPHISLKCNKSFPWVAPSWHKWTCVKVMLSCVKEQNLSMFSMFSSFAASSMVDDTPVIVESSVVIAFCMISVVMEFNCWYISSDVFTEHPSKLGCFAPTQTRNQL